MWIETSRNVSSFVVPGSLQISPVSIECGHYIYITLMTQISGSWLKSELKKIAVKIPHSVLVAKLTGDNTREEKERVMELFKSG